MEHQHAHGHHDHHQHSHHHMDHSAHAAENENYLKLAISATLHCLLGCGIGEVVGIIIGTAVGFSIMDTMILGVVLGFVFGLALGVRPLLHAGFRLSRAVKQVLIAEGLSIAVMETAEVLVAVYTPGVMDSGLANPLFWWGMILALAAGFMAALPVNYIFVRNGIRHQH